MDRASDSAVDKEADTISQGSPPKDVLNDQDETTLLPKWIEKAVRLDATGLAKRFPKTSRNLREGKLSPDELVLSRVDPVQEACNIKVHSPIRGYEVGLRVAENEQTLSHERDIHEDDLCKLVLQQAPGRVALPGFGSVCPRAVSSDYTSQTFWQKWFSGSDSVCIECPVRGMG